MSDAGAFLIIGLICVGWGMFQLGLGDIARHSWPHTPAWPSKLAGYISLGLGCLILIAALLVALKAPA
jgi:uncharacterized membrane protein YkvI